MHSRENDPIQQPNPNVTHPETDMKVQRNEGDRDRFELLSAYFDGEVTSRERQQVQEWLDSDAEVQCLYRRLLQLRQGLQGMPVPATTRSTEEIAANVFRAIERRRIRRFAILGGGAIAAAMVAAVSLFLPVEGGFAPRMARTPESKPSLSNEVPDDGLLVALDRPVVSIPPATDTLMIPLDRPVVEIPKAATTQPEN
ncbi:MAG: Fis family transcriptional regulator [Cyanobacteria bacterium P01_E01_bin.42]